MIDTVIFDFAGVITKTNFISSLIKECEDKFGMDADNFKKAFLENEPAFTVGEMNLEEFWRAACKGYDVPFEDFRAVFSNAYEINPEMVELLKKLKTDYAVVMLSDSFEGLAESVRANPNLAGLFERIFLSNEIRMAKLTPGCFEYVLKVLGKAPEECIFIDDKEKNLVPAADLGIGVIRFTGVENLKDELRKKGVRA